MPVFSKSSFSRIFYTYAHMCIFIYISGDPDASIVCKKELFITLNISFLLRVLKMVPLYVLSPFSSQNFHSTNNSKKFFP